MLICTVIMGCECKCKYTHIHIYIYLFIYVICRRRQVNALVLGRLTDRLRLRVLLRPPVLTIIHPSNGYHVS